MNRAPVDSLLGSPPPPLELHSKAERPPETKPRASTTFNEEATSQNLFAEDLHFRPLEGGPPPLQARNRVIGDLEDEVRMALRKDPSLHAASRPTAGSSEVHQLPIESGETPRQASWSGRCGTYQRHLSCRILNASAKGSLLSPFSEGWREGVVHAESAVEWRISGRV